MEFGFVCTTSSGRDPAAARAIPDRSDVRSDSRNTPIDDGAWGGGDGGRRLNTGAGSRGVAGGREATGGKVSALSTAGASGFGAGTFATATSATGRSAMAASEATASGIRASAAFARGCGAEVVT